MERAGELNGTRDSTVLVMFASNSFSVLRPRRARGSVQRMESPQLCFEAARFAQNA